MIAFQARRRRILEQGKDRIKYVNGVVDAVPSASASDPFQLIVVEKPKNGDVVPSVEGDEEGVGGGGGALLLLPLPPLLLRLLRIRMLPARNQYSPVLSV